MDLRLHGPATALLKVNVSRKFLLRFEYCQQGLLPAKAGAELRHSDFFTRIPSTAELGRHDQWCKFVIEGVENPGKVVIASTEDDPEKSSGWDIDRQVTSIWIEVPPGTQLALRNIKSNGSYAYPSNAFWFAAIIALLTLVAAATVRWFYRPKSLPTNLSQAA
jgi:hypothetical protein